MIIQERNYFLTSKTIFIFFVLIFFVSPVALGQDYESFYEKSTRINQSGMYFLGGWAVANLTLGTYGWINETGHKMYFHQMNAAWNTVNLAIAGFALWDMTQGSMGGMSPDEMMAEHKRIENLYLINAGLDVLYMAGGAWMLHASKNNEKRADLLKGYGRSVILQGAFLFAFDLIKFTIQNSHRSAFEQTAIGLSPEGLSLIVRF